MTFPFHTQGQVATQAHVAVPDGLFEEEHGRQGFYGPVSHVYHRHAPTGWSRIDGPLQPRAYKLNALPEAAYDMEAGKTWLLGHDTLRMGLVQFTETNTYISRNADGDELYFIHAGHGHLQTDYGWLPVQPGSYVLLPKGVSYRWCVAAPLTLLLIESTQPFTLPPRGAMGQHAPFDPNCLIKPVLQTPALAKALANDKGEPVTQWPVRIKRFDQMTQVVYPFDPLDVAGWKGNLYPCVLQVRDIRPVHSHRLHLPPSVHATWQAGEAVVCTFLPRPLETDPLAQQVPFYHRNIDYDEVIFYHDGDFFSRDGLITPGMLTWHPAGIHHGPHPKAYANQHQHTHTQEIAVMLDSPSPLMATMEAASIELEGYAMSWQQP
jgi:homogentisate 1,2-dioxygenase